jgi:hypothetical protein
MNVDLARLRRFVPALVLVVTVALGWMIVVRPVSADRASADARLAALRQREAALRATVTEPSALAAAMDPVAAFDRRVASDDPTAVVVERLARLASEVRARELFIETIEGATPTGAGAPPLPGTYRPDPRFALFDRPVSYATIRMSFDVGYAGLGQFLWSFRDLPTIVEIRTFNVQPRDVSPGETPGVMLQASFTLFAYRRSSQTPGTAGVVTE